MTKKIQACWKSLDRKIIVNQRELVLGLAVCALAGIVAGIALSPRKTVTIGSNNGSNNTGNSPGLTTGGEAEDDSSDEEAQED